MNIAVDIIIALIGAAVIAFCTWRGFIRSVFGMIKLAVAVILFRILIPFIFPEGSYLTRIIAYLIVFAVIYTVLTVAVLLLDRFFRLPVLKQTNRLLGFIFGVICAYVLLSVLTAVVALIAELAGSTGLFGMTREQLEAQTVLFRFFSRFGIFALLINN